MKKIAFFVVLSLVSGYASAARVTTPWFKIQEAGPDGNGPFVAVAPAGVADNCTGGFNWFAGVAETTDDGYRNSVSTVLAAFMGDKEIMVEYDDSTASCYVYKTRVR